VQLVGNVFQANKIDIYMSGDSSIGYDLLIANNTFSQATESSTVVYLPGRPYADGITLRGNTFKDMSPTTTVLLLQEPTSAISSSAMDAGVTVEGNTFHDIIIPAAKTGFVMYKATGAAVRHVEVRTAPVFDAHPNFGCLIFLFWHTGTLISLINHTTASFVYA